MTEPKLPVPEIKVSTKKFAAMVTVLVLWLAYIATLAVLRRMGI